MSKKKQKRLLPEQLPTVIEEVIIALRKANKYRDKSRDFAQSIVNKIDPIQSYVADLPLSIDFIDALANVSSKVYLELLNFNKLLYKPSNNQIIKALRFTMNQEVPEPIDLKNFTSYFKDLSSNLYEVYKIKNKSGTDNTEAFIVAVMIAEQYKQFFGNFPSLGKSTKIDSRKSGMKIKETPYDKVCNVISEFYDIEISDYTRSKAIERAKMKDALPPK